MKSIIFNGTMLVILFVTLSFSGIDNGTKKMKMLGTWEYAAPDAPYQYQKGEIHFLMQNNELVGFISIQEYKTELENVVAKGDKVTCEVYIEGETVTLELLFKKKTFKGTASYSEGTLDFNGKKKG